jgi:competence protein ComEA
MNPVHKQSVTRKLIPALLALVMAFAAMPTFAAEAGVVNINSASAEELALLPRVGPAVAGRIIAFREENGKFEATEDLMLVRGIGERTYELLKPFVTIDGETTLVEKVRASSLTSTEERE